MALLEVALICLSFVSCVGICAGAYFLSEQRKAEIQQNGINSRAVLRQKTDESASIEKQEWYVPILVELLKNPQIQNLALQKIAPMLTQPQAESILTK